jgi:predicted ester cyclase
MNDLKSLAIDFLNTIESGNLDIFDDIIHPNYKPGLESMTPTTKDIVQEISQDANDTGIKPLKSRFRKFLKIWQNPKIEIIDLVHEDDKIIVYYQLEFNYAQSMLGINPKGKRISVKVYHNFRVKEGKICHAHMLLDYYDIIKQIEADETLTDPFRAIHDYLETIKSEGLTKY